MLVNPPKRLTIIPRFPNLVLMDNKNKATKKRLSAWEVTDSFDSASCVDSLLISIGEHCSDAGGVWSMTGDRAGLYTFADGSAVSIDYAADRWRVVA